MKCPRFSWLKALQWCEQSAPRQSAVNRSGDFTSLSTSGRRLSVRSPVPTQRCSTRASVVPLGCHEDLSSSCGMSSYSWLVRQQCYVYSHDRTSSHFSLINNARIAHRILKYKSIVALRHCSEWEHTMYQPRPLLYKPMCVCIKEIIIKKTILGWNVFGMYSINVVLRSRERERERER